MGWIVKTGSVGGTGAAAFCSGAGAGAGAAVSAGFSSFLSCGVVSEPWRDLDLRLKIFDVNLLNADMVAGRRWWR